MITSETVFLVVDDVDSMRKINSAQLERIGARKILLANNGMEALKILRSRRVDVVLCDWNMPVLDGLSLLKELRNDPKLESLPFVMVTAESSRSQIAEAIAAGVSSILVKPYNAQDLVIHIHRSMTHKYRKPKLSTITDAPPVVEPAAIKRPTVLIVDDMPENLTLLAELFKQDYRVLVAKDAASALSLCTSTTAPDLILLDVMMPGMDGFELAQHLRTLPTTSRIPIIFVTAMTDKAAQLRGLELGAVDFVSKPIDPKFLQLRVLNLLKLVEQRKELQHDYDNLLELERLREDATSMSRHDLKAPLCSILGLSENLLGAGNLMARQMQALGAIQSDCHMLLGMLDLDAEIYKIENSRFQLNPVPVDLLLIMRRICESARLTYRAKSLTIEFVVDESHDLTSIVASADELLCFSLLNNLLKNACEAAPLNSLVSVKIEQRDVIELTMENQPAVPEIFRPHFFDKYASYGKSTGSGLGTYSAKLLSEAQKGSLTLEVDDDANITRLRLILLSAD